MTTMTTDVMSADEAQRLLDGREAKGRWRTGTVEHEGKVWAHDPDALGGASVGEVCIFLANKHYPHNGNRALCAAAPRLAASVIALHAQLAQVTAERDALRAIVEGRTTPPTWQEIERHHESGGSWIFSAGGVADVSERASVTHRWADDHRDLPGMGGCRWWPLDTNGRPCAWPVADR